VPVALNHGGIPFPVDRRKNVTSLFNFWLGFSYSLCQKFPFIFLRSKVIQEFHAYAMVKNIFHFLGANMTARNLFANIRTPKGTSLRKSATIEALWSRWLFPFGL
jgi:hypothetical protein